ncbi:DNA binding methylated-DNA--cysteine S-methyltransferase [Myriangium duriaei CBS 260.36]|uniref:Methylated-DNA--protein-cysteine methyltransferase n=1 Tax=Myriangium duriaei CBS 260.36 TaxID=1168546 RepID=A0A9P4IUQ5_9PEZI|nr:DNA binding methylated-DNA--cysteine S-methyltransferase [Myriangium duriaei CBS 260.36]
MPSITEFQERVYAYLSQVPEGKVTTYNALARALKSSPRAVGGALRRNPYAPIVPCHRCIAATGYVGGFLGDWHDAPSGQNQSRKLELLRGEGVEFDTRGYLVDKERRWDGFKHVGKKIRSPC